MSRYGGRVQGRILRGGPRAGFHAAGRDEWPQALPRRPVLSGFRSAARIDPRPLGGPLPHRFGAEAAPDATARRIVSGHQQARRRLPDTPARKAAIRTSSRLYAALCRSRRNWKNSTPSRSRRFIICGLRTISPTMEAIFGARK